MATDLPPQIIDSDEDDSSPPPLEEVKKDDAPSADSIDSDDDDDSLPPPLEAVQYDIPPAMLRVVACVRNVFSNPNVAHPDIVAVMGEIVEGGHYSGSGSSRGTSLPPHFTIPRGCVNEEDELHK